MKDIDMGILIPVTLPQIIAEVADIDILIPSTIYLVITEDIIVVMLLEVDLGYKIPATIPLFSS